MVSDSIKKDILDSFPSSSKKDWINIASKELEGADPLERLRKSNHGLTVFPYYDTSDQINTPFQLPISTDIYNGNRAWENLSVVHLNKSFTANQEALLALQSGADGILFSVEENSFSELFLKNIQWQHCSLRFFATKGQENFFTSLGEFVLKQNLKQKISPKELKGSVFWKSAPHDIVTVIKSFEKFEKFRCCGVFLQERESKQEMIADGLLQAIHFIDTATLQNIPTSQSIPQIAFCVPLDADFFLGIAVLKSLRRLWYQICTAYDPSADATVHIHAHSTAFTKPQYQAHANLIKSSTTALAAIAGGCDSLSIESEDPENITLSRIARNVSSLLREESHLDLVADPTAGSYYIENLTDQLSQRSWELFQKRATS